MDENTRFWINFLVAVTMGVPSWIVLAREFRKRTTLARSKQNDISFLNKRGYTVVFVITAASIGFGVYTLVRFYSSHSEFDRADVVRVLITGNVITAQVLLLVVARILMLLKDLALWSFSESAELRAEVKRLSDSVSNVDEEHPGNGAPVDDSPRKLPSKNSVV